MKNTKPNLTAYEVTPDPRGVNIRHNILSRGINFLESRGLYPFPESIRKLSMGNLVLFYSQNESMVGMLSRGEKTYAVFYGTNEQNEKSEKRMSSLAKEFNSRIIRIQESDLEEIFKELRKQ